MLRRKPEVAATNLKEIGRGGQSTVYSVLDPDHGAVAIKVFHLASNNALEHYQRERDVLNRLSSVESTVDVYRTGETQFGEPYLVMQLLEKSLQDVIDENGPVPWTQACRHMISVSQAVDQAHRHGIIHADLKPSNILLNKEGTTFVSDFGISKIVDTEKTATTRIGFTPNYAAPETLNDDQESTRSDIYGLGATIAALVMGHPPFESSGIFRIMERAVHEPPPTLTEFGAPLRLTNLVRRAMAKDPDQRFATAAALGNELTACIDGQGQDNGIKEDEDQWNKPGTEENSDQDISERPWWRQPKTIMAALAVTLIAIGGGLWYTARLDNPRTVSVALDASGDYTTIAAAIKAVPAGSTINISGEFHQILDTLVVDKPISIVGAGKGETRLIGKSEGPVIKANTELELRDLTISNESSDKNTDVVSLTNSEIRVIDVSVSGGTRHGLFADGETVGVIENSDFSNNDSSGLVQNDSTKLKLTNNTSTGNNDSGFVWNDKTAGEAQTNTAERNEDEGFLVRGTAKPNLELNTATKNRQSGFTWADSAQGSARNNNSTLNTVYGFVALLNSKPNLIDNAASENRKSGFAWHHNSSGTSTANTATNNGFHGYVISDPASPTIEKSKASDNSESGFMWFSTKKGKLISNTAQDNTLNGFSFGKIANVSEILKNTATGNTQNGFMWFGPITAKVTDNLSRGNAGDGFTLGNINGSDFSTNRAENNEQFGFSSTNLEEIQTTKNTAANNEKGDWLDPSQPLAPNTQDE